MHYSRVMPPEGDHQYFTSTAVFLNEVIKLAISLTLALYETSKTLAPSTPATVLFEQIYNGVFSSDGWMLAVPAALYTLQNLLQYVAVGNLDPVHFQVLYQVKVCLPPQACCCSCPVFNNLSRSSRQPSSAFSYCVASSASKDGRLSSYSRVASALFPYHLPKKQPTRYSCTASQTTSSLDRNTNLAKLLLAQVFPRQRCILASDPLHMKALQKTWLLRHL